MAVIIRLARTKEYGSRARAGSLDSGGARGGAFPQHDLAGNRDDPGLLRGLLAEHQAGRHLAHPGQRQPATATAPGTEIPAARSRASAPTAMTSFTANTQSGRGPPRASTVLIAS